VQVLASKHFVKSARASGRRAQGNIMTRHKRKYKKKTFWEKYSSIFTVFGNVAQIATVLATFLMIKYTIVPIYQKEYLEEQNTRIQIDIDSKQKIIKDQEEKIIANNNKLKELKEIALIFDYKNYVLQYYNTYSFSSMIILYLDTNKPLDYSFKENSIIQDELINDYCVIKMLDGNTKEDLKMKLAGLNINKDKSTYKNCFNEIKNEIEGYKKSLEEYKVPPTIPNEYKNNNDLSTKTKEELADEMSKMAQLLYDRLLSVKIGASNIEKNNKCIEKVIKIADKYPTYYMLLDEYIEKNFRQEL
jgi:hypothetical protein